MTGPSLHPFGLIRFVRPRIKIAVGVALARVVLARVALIGQSLFGVQRDRAVGAGGEHPVFAVQRGRRGEIGRVNDLLWG